MNKVNEGLVKVRYSEYQIGERETSFSDKNSCSQNEQKRDHRINPQVYGQLILDTVPKTHNGERTVASINGGGKTGYLHGKERNYTPILHHSYKLT